MDCKGIQPVHPKWDQFWVFIGRTDAEAEAPILWPPEANSQFTGKDPDTGKDWREKKKRVTEDEMVGWHHWFNGQKLGQTMGYGEGQRSLAGYNPWRHKDLDMTWWLTTTNSWKLATNCYTFVSYQLCKKEYDYLQMNTNIFMWKQKKCSWIQSNSY